MAIPFQRMRIFLEDLKILAIPHCLDVNLG